MKRIASIVTLCLLCDLHALCLKNKERTFTETCDKVWPAVVSVSNYLSAGGVWSGERLVTLSLAPGVEGGCKASAQSRFSGLAHSDGLDLLSRIEVQLMAIKLNLDDDAVGKVFRRYNDCMASATPDSKGEANVHKTLDALKHKQPTQDDMSQWWHDSAKDKQ